MEKNSKQNIGNAGEYYIASRLSAENFIATITLGRAERYDIIAINPMGKAIKISVKSRFDLDIKRFPLSDKDEKGGTEDFYYAFVRLNEFKKEPDFWIVPSIIVNKVIFESSDIYFNKKLRRDGQKYNDVGLRNFWLEINKTNKDLYPENWEKELEKYYKNLSQLK